MNQTSSFDAASNESNVALNHTTNDAQTSQDSQTAADYISSQLQLEADAREALPYQFDTCTYPLGPLRQSVFSCLTCRPPPSDPITSYSPAGVCYSCSISCHGEHELVEIFTRRNFVCDCGTTRLPAASSCSLRINEQTGKQGGVHSEEPSATNRYNQNFRNRFCGCGELYDAHQEEGTMYQCYGLGNVEDGGCGEDWWHPECILGLKRDWYKQEDTPNGLNRIEHKDVESHALTTSIVDNENDRTNQDAQLQPDASATDEPGLQEGRPDPPGFPEEDDFDHLICYKCVAAFPWIKRYAGTPGFLPGVAYIPNRRVLEDTEVKLIEEIAPSSTAPIDPSSILTGSSNKRKAEDDLEEVVEPPVKKAKSEEDESFNAPSIPQCRYSQLPTAASGDISLFLKSGFRDHLCRCRACFPNLMPHPQLLEEEAVYEPPISNSSSIANGDGTGNGSPSVGSRSLLDRGEAALSNMDRVRAIEGVMAYNHLRDKVKDFLKPFAESGTAVGAEDVKKYFEKLRGDEEAIKMAQMRRSGGDGGGDESDNRREQGGH